MSVSFEPGVTVLLGRNGQGKTNLVEALNYVATLGSHRVATDAPLVRTGCSQALVQVGVRESAESDRTTKVEFTISGSRSSVATVNGNKVTRTREVLGLLRTVLFCPEDLALVKGDPGERRRFVDELLIARYPRYAAVLADYSRVLRQRSSLLKSAAAVARRGEARESLYSTLDVWDDQFATLGARLVAGRLNSIDALRSPAIARHDWLAGGFQELHLSYAASSPNLAALLSPGGTPNEADVEDALRADLAQRRDDEIRRGVTLVGPQRDDIFIGLGGTPAKGYASHGESWSIALALRLASFDLLREQFGNDPVLLLDDVFAELDSARRGYLTEAVRAVEQVIITAAVREDVPEELATRCIEISRAGNEPDAGAHPATDATQVFDTKTSTAGATQDSSPVSNGSATAITARQAIGATDHDRSSIDSPNESQI